MLNKLFFKIFTFLMGMFILWNLTILLICLSINLNSTNTNEEKGLVYGLLIACIFLIITSIINLNRILKFIFQKCINEIKQTHQTENIKELS